VDKSPSLQERYRGAMLGLATGDAIGTALEFKPPGTFDPISDMVGGGPFRLVPGQWTDDTSMAICLAESLVDRQAFDPEDQMRRYLSWCRGGISAATVPALISVALSVPPSGISRFIKTPFPVRPTPATGATVL